MKPEPKSHSEIVLYQTEDGQTRIRDIRSSERRFYQRVLDIYATSVDYDPSAEASELFFATVQNKMHWATHGQTGLRSPKHCPRGWHPLPIHFLTIGALG